MDVFLQEMAFQLGDKEFDVVATAKEGLLISKPETLLEAGFRKHFRCSRETTALDLALAACKKLDPERLSKVDAIIYSTCLPQNQNSGSLQKAAETKDVKYFMDFPASRLQAALNLDKAFVVGLCQQACTGLLFGVRMARDLLVSESNLNSVLVITADRFPDGYFYEQTYNLICDGAVASIVGREEHGFKYLAGHSITNGALSLANDDETAGSWFNYTHRLVTETLERAKLSLSDIKWIVSQNMNNKGWMILARILGFPEANVAAPTLSEVGHMISGDNIVNTLSLIQSKKLQKGDRLLLPMAGYGLNWAGLVLEWRGA